MYEKYAPSRTSQPLSSFTFAILGVIAAALMLTGCATKQEAPTHEHHDEVELPEAAQTVALARSLGRSALSNARDEAGDRFERLSTSTGTTADGELRGGIPLEHEGKFHSIIERLRRFENRWGTGELVHLVRHTARYVHHHEGGARLRVGELSKEGGGDLPWHRSHNSGRDVDLAFYVVDAETGESVPAPKQVRFDGNGRSRTHPHLRFDLARNWRLVEAMLAHVEVPVQWIFVSGPIEEMLLDHAEGLGVRPEIISRASELLHQPSRASSHANHFHVRISCSPDDRDLGCIDKGPVRAWNRDDFESGRASRDSMAAYEAKVN